MLPLLLVPAAATAAPWHIDAAAPLLGAYDHVQHSGTLDDGRAFVEIGANPEVFDGKAWHFVGDGVVVAIGPAARIPGGLLLARAAFVGHPIRGALVWDAKTGAWRETGGPLVDGRLHSGELTATLADGSVLVLAPDGRAERWTARADAFQDAGRVRTPRGNGTLTALPDGRALLVGGAATHDPGGATKQCDLYDPKTNTWTATADLHAWRSDHTATLLPDGRVLVAGGEAYGRAAVAEVEIWSPKTGAWTIAATLHEPRYAHGAALLPGNRVMFVGGLVDSDPFGPNTHVALSAETLDVATGRWEPVFYPPRAYIQPNVEVLADGRVLVAGGHTKMWKGVDKAEVWAPGDGPDAPWELAATPAQPKPLMPSNMYDDPYDHLSRTPLPDGGALAVGRLKSGALGAERWDPATATWRDVALAAGRLGHVAVALPDGRVVLAGGVGLAPPSSMPRMRMPPGPTVRVVEVFDPKTGTSTTAGALLARREHAAAAVLADGRVIVTGGDATASAEVWSPKTHRSTAVASMHVIRAQHTATTLPDGRVVVIGGDTAGTFEVYDPAKNRWSEPRALPEPWSLHTAELLPDGRVLVTAGGRAVALRVD
ncbi:MAG TPA: kelch repeat-containing protein [Kofleriaceae bacterium]|nr:kelch repeat-containing protein [Kofleriaceae bacterium]